MARTASLEKVRLSQDRFKELQHNHITSYLPKTQPTKVKVVGTFHVPSTKHAYNRWVADGKAELACYFVGCEVQERKKGDTPDTPFFRVGGFPKSTKWIVPYFHFLSFLRKTS